MRRLGCCGLFLTLLLTSCADTEIVGLHVNLRADGTGIVTARSLVQPTEAGPAEGPTQGVVWQDRVSLTFSQGAFQDLSSLRFGSISFGGDPKNADRPMVRVLVPRGPDQSWVKALVPELEVRRKLAKVYDPSGKTNELGGTVRIELQLPANVIATGVQPTGRGVDVDHERNRAWLTVPVQTALEKGDDLVWDVSWVTPH